MWKRNMKRYFDIIKKIKSLLPLAGLLLFHVLFCGFLTLTETGKAFLVFILITIWFWLVIDAGLFYLCGRWAERYCSRTIVGQICVALLCGMLYATAVPFFISLESLLQWGRWSASVIGPKPADILFVLVPFQVAFVSCLLGQVLERKKSLLKQK